MEDAVMMSDGDAHRVQFCTSWTWGCSFCFLPPLVLLVCPLNFQPSKPQVGLPSPLLYSSLLPKFSRENRFSASHQVTEVTDCFYASCVRLYLFISVVCEFISVYMCRV